MHALVEWTEEEKVSVISLTRVKEPRKDFGQYNLGEVVKASCHGFPGVHNAKILSIRESTIEGKKQLEKLAEEYIEDKNQSAAEKNVAKNTQPSTKAQEDQNNNSTAVSKEKTKQKKGRKSATQKEDDPKKTKHQENKENKAEKEKKREENKRKKEVGLKKNAEFLQSLDIFKQQTASSQQPQLQVTAPNYQETQLPGQQNGMLQHNNPYQPMQQMTHPYNYWQSTPQHNQMHYGQQHQQQSLPSNEGYPQQSLPSNEGYPSHQVSSWQNLPNQTFHPLRPNYMNSAYYASTDPNEQNSTLSSFAKIPVMAEEIEKGDEILDSFLARKEVQELSDDTDEMETIPTEDEIQKCKSALKEKERELHDVKKKLAETEKELETLKSTSCTCATSQPGEWKTQKNGLPRAGIIPKDLAEKSGMMELMPNSGVFVYPKDIRVCGKKESGTAMARYLMSVFYTNEELVTRGNLMGTNGKDGLNRQIVNTIIAFAVIKGKDTESVIKYSMRTKISALISHERKKTNVDN